MPQYDKLFNCVLDTGSIPTTLEGVVIPIFKNKGVLVITGRSRY